MQPVATDVQEFAMTVIPADTRAEPLKIEPDILTNTVNGLHYAIEFEQPVKSGEPVQATLHVTQADGSGYAQLEPIMGAFAHIVGFRDDRTSALHIHPEIARPLNAPRIVVGRICVFVFTPRNLDFTGYLFRCSAMANRSLFPLP